MNNYITFPFYIPRIFRLITNWPRYFFNYVLRRKKPAVYHLRDGTQLNDATGTLAGTIAVVFVRREYGVLRDYNTIVDIGANLGCFAIYAARQCDNPNVRIFCFEPVESNFRVLQENIRSNSLEGRIMPFKFAVAGSSGERTIMRADSPINSFEISYGSSKTESVICTTIPEIIESHGLSEIDLLKVNCEGAEYEIFEKCPKRDLNRIRRIRLEYHNLDNERRNGVWLKKWLEENEFRVIRFSCDRGKSGFIWADRIPASQ